MNNRLKIDHLLVAHSVEVDYVIYGARIDAHK